MLQHGRIVCILGDEDILANLIDRSTRQKILHGFELAEHAQRGAGLDLAQFVA